MTNLHDSLRRSANSIHAARPLVSRPRRAHTLLASLVVLLLAALAVPLGAEDGDDTGAAEKPAPTKKGTMKPATLPAEKDHKFNDKVPRFFSGRNMTFDSSSNEGSLTAHAYVAGAPNADRQILLIHEWWGMNEHIKGLADQFGRMGYRAYAIDLYDGQSATKTSEARALMGKAMEDPDGLLDRIRVVLIAMHADNKNAKRATIGWCFGGGWSLQAAINNPDLVDASVVYYGQLETDPEILASIDAPVLGVFADKDGWITPQLVEEFEAGMKEAGKSVTIEMYEADHAFANPSGDRFQLEAARDAWGKTVAFLNEHLSADEAETKE